LRRYPRWRAGHYRLGVASLARNDIATTYASAQAFLALTRTDTAEAGTGYLLLGQCYLRRGAAAESIPYLEEARRRLPHNHTVTEELGAAYMAGADYPRALALLSSIPATDLSPATQAALAFLRSQTAGA
jgi:tetratricopeptide (TPR) repeat protein